MNIEILLFYVAAGSLSKLLTLKHPSLGQQWAAGIEVFIGGLVVGLLIPPQFNYPAAVGIGTPYGAAIFGRVLGQGIDRTRLKLDLKRKEGYGRSTKDRRPEGKNPKRRGGIGGSSGD